MKKYCAFLRGINVGGNRTIKMQEVKEILQKIPLHNIQTILASGNVYFESNEKDTSILEKKIKTVLDVEVLVRSEEEILNLIQRSPFENTSIADQKFYVSFLGEKNSDFSLHKQKGFETLYVSEKEVCSTISLSKEMGTTEAMKILEKMYGKNITTRNWNTIQKLSKLLKN